MQSSWQVLLSPTPLIFRYLTILHQAVSCWEHEPHILLGSQSSFEEWVENHILSEVEKLPNIPNLHNFYSHQRWLSLDDGVYVPSRHKRFQLKSPCDTEQGRKQKRSLLHQFRGTSCHPVKLYMSVFSWYDFCEPVTHMHSLSYNFVCLSKICYSILVSPHKDEMNLHRVKVNYMI